MHEFHYQAKRGLPKNRRLRDEDLVTDKLLPPHWIRLYPDKNQLIGQFLVRDIASQDPLISSDVQGNPDLSTVQAKRLTLASLLHVDLADIAQPGDLAAISCGKDEGAKACGSTEIAALMCESLTEEEGGAETECRAWVGGYTSEDCQTCAELIVTAIERQPLP